jgi:hypothetical protein
MKIKEREEMNDKAESKRVEKQIGSKKKKSEREARNEGMKQKAMLLCHGVAFVALY